MGALTRWVRAALSPSRGEVIVVDSFEASDGPPDPADHARWVAMRREGVPTQPGKVPPPPLSAGEPIDPVPAD